MNKAQVTQAWKSLMSSSFSCKASKDRNSLEFQAWGEGRWANHQGSKSLTGSLGRLLAVQKGREPPAEEEPWAPGGVGGCQHRAWEQDMHLQANLRAQGMKSEPVPLGGC